MEDLATLEIRRLRERVMELEAIVKKQNQVLLNVAGPAPHLPSETPPASGDDPCEQCGLPCDGSRCPGL